MLARAETLRRAADMFEAQASSTTRDNDLWIKSIVDRDIGRDVDYLVQDVRRYEKTARNRDKTWANPKNKEETRRMRNTMGYQIDIE